MSPNTTPSAPSVTTPLPLPWCERASPSSSSARRGGSVESSGDPPGFIRGRAYPQGARQRTPPRPDAVGDASPDRHPNPRNPRWIPFGFVRRPARSTTARSGRIIFDGLLDPVDAHQALLVLGLDAR